MAKNEGKKFEEDFMDSVPDTCWVYRLRDNASSFANGKNTRFTSRNICDYIMYDDLSKSLFLIECKSTKSKSIPIAMIRENQIDGLKKASEHNLTAGILVNFRNDNNDTFFVEINKFIHMTKSINKKSFNINDFENVGAIKVKNTKKRTRYRYNIECLINNV